MPQITREYLDNVADYLVFKAGVVRDDWGEIVDRWNDHPVIYTASRVAKLLTQTEDFTQKLIIPTYYDLLDRRHPQSEAQDSERAAREVVSVIECMGYKMDAEVVEASPELIARGYSPYIIQIDLAAGLK